MRTKWVICASGLFLLIILGCKSFNAAGLFALQSDPTGGPRVVAGSLDVVAQSVQSKLGQLGIEAVASKQGEMVRINCKNSNGLRFAVVLTKQPALTKQVPSEAGGTEQTKVAFEWSDQSNNEIALQIFSHVETANRR